MTQRSPMNLRVSRETKITVASYSDDYRFTSQLTMFSMFISHRDVILNGEIKAT